MSPWWKMNLRHSSQRFEPPYVRSTSVFSCNPILHFSSSLSYVYIDSSTAFSPLANVAGSSATISPLSPYVTYQRKPYERGVWYLRHNSVIARWRRRRQYLVEKRNIRKIPGIYRNFYVTKLTLARCFFRFYLRTSSEPRVDNTDRSYACHSIAIYRTSGRVGRIVN